jgi:autotransporter-associated beta strand protein
MIVSRHKSVGALMQVGFALAFLTGTGTPFARAQTISWNTRATSGGSWGNAGNWEGGVIPSGTDVTAAFNINFLSGSSVTLDGNRTVGTVTTTSVNPWSIDPGTGGTLTVATVSVTGNGALTVSAALAGTTFTKTGGGTLIVSNSGGSYSGAINVNAGTLRLTGSGSYSPGGNTVTVASGATLDVTGLTGGSQYGGAPTTLLGLNSGDTLTGTGTVSGGLKVASGATVYPGDNGIGALSVSGAGDFASGSNWKVKLGTANPGAGNTSNRIDFTALLKLDSGANLLIDGSGLTFTPNQTYDYVIATAGAGNFTIGSVNFQPTNFPTPEYIDSTSFSLTTSGNDLILHVTPVPEPALALALSLAGAAGSGAFRRVLVRRTPTGR